MNRSPATSAKPKSDPIRNRELGVIHTAKKALALTDDSYRGLIGRFSKGRTESSADLTAGERRSVIEYFRQIGFTAKAKARTPAARRADYRPQAMKLKAMWYALHQLGIVRNGSQDACAAFVCRHTKIQAMRWNYPEHLHLAIECLKAWSLREGYDPKPCDVAGPQLGSFRPGLIRAQWARLEVLRPGTCGDVSIWLAWLGAPGTSPEQLDDDTAEEAIRALGKRLRAATPEAETDD